MRPWLLFLSVAIGVAALAAVLSSDDRFEEKLVRLETERALPSIATQLEREPPEINLLFLNYAADPSQWMSAALAIRNHGDIARDVLLDYGALPEFQDVLVRFGSDAVLPIHFFHSNDIATLRARNWVNERWEQLKALWSDAPADPPQALTPFRKGLIAIALIDASGHGLLDQFEVDADREVIWLQGERVVSAVGDFFTGGLRDLEREWRRGEEVGVGDLGWAGLDLLVMAGTVKLLRPFKGGPIRRPGPIGAPGGPPAGARFASLAPAAKIAAVLGLGYVVIRHPALLSALGANLSNWLGWPTWVGQFLVWFVVLMPFLFVLRGLAIWVIGPCLRRAVPVFRWLGSALTSRPRETT